MKMGSANEDTFLKQFIEITFHLEVKVLFKLKRIGYYWMKEKNCIKISQVLCNCYSHINSFSKFEYGGMKV